MVCGGEISVFFQYIDPAAKEWKRLVSRVLVMLSAHQPGQLVLHLDGSLPALLDNEGRPVPGIFPEVCDSPGESGQTAAPPLPSSLQVSCVSVSSHESHADDFVGHFPIVCY